MSWTDEDTPALNSRYRPDHWSPARDCAADIRVVFLQTDKKKAERLGYVGNYTRLGNSCWYTNIDHGRRHEPLPLMSMEDNIIYSKHKEIRGKGYKRYENYEAIDIPYTDAIPIDYDGEMGVPKTFLDKYCLEQFEIIGLGHGNLGVKLGIKPYDRALKKLLPIVPYTRIVIRKKQ